MGMGFQVSDVLLILFYDLDLCQGSIQIVFLTDFDVA